MNQIQFTELEPGFGPILCAGVVVGGCGCPWLMIYPPGQGFAAWRDGDEWTDQQ